MPTKKKEKVPPLGKDFRKFQPKLRMIANCDSAVNAIRAEMSASIKVQDREYVEEMPALRGDKSVPKKWSEIPENCKRGSQKSVPDDIIVNVFIESNDTVAGKGAIPGQKGHKSNLMTARVSLRQLKTIGSKEGVTRVELGEALAEPMPEVSKEKPKPPHPRRFGSPGQHKKGEGVLIGIIDVGGFDFSHPDFLDKRGRTRFERIWDQGALPGSSRPSPNVPNHGQFDYGAEFTKEHLNIALKAARRLGVPPYELERQSQMSVGSHATHVASIAAGKRGICPKARIAGVLISMPKEDQERRQSFYDSTRVADAVDYLVGVADELSRKLDRPVPLSINVSLGTNGHAHDGSSAISRWIDAAMAVPGRSITVAAGNAGQEVAAFQGDRGYVMGRIHTSGMVPARGLVKDIEWMVVGNGELDLSENELEIWYSSQDRFAVEVRPPRGGWIGPIEPRQYIENQQLADGSFLSIYNELYHPANGSNYISIYLSPFFTRKGVVGVPAGRWAVRLHGLEVRDGHYHGWIERDDPRRLGRVGDKEAWRFPSFFSEGSNVDDSQVSSLACGRRVIGVANLDEAKECINRTSSQGPTRDNRFKPDIAAPGTDVVAAKGFAGDKDRWVKMSGTSMASPFVAGVAGLMLAANPKLTAAQIEGIIVRTARPLPGGSFKWANNAGYGRINPEACLKEAVAMKAEKEDRTKKSAPANQGKAKTVKRPRKVGSGGKTR